MTYDEFELPFRRLAMAFGLAFSKERCTVYYDRMRKLEVARWTDMVRHWTETGGTFPKIADLVRMREFKGTEDGPAEDPTQEWLTHDCIAVECVDGLVPVGQWKDEYYPLYGPETTPGLVFEREVSYRCPKCRRSDKDHPRMPIWKRELTIRTDDEMNRRTKERHEIVLAGGRASIAALMGGGS